MSIEFRSADIISDIIAQDNNVILALKENVNDLEPTRERLYFMAKASKLGYRIYTKVNEFVLELFFQGRISVKEIFLLRIDEPFVLERIGGNEQEQLEVHYDKTFHDSYLDNLDFGSNAYHSIPQDMKVLSSPLDDELRMLKENYYINAHGAAPANRFYGKDWVKKHL